MRILHNRDLIQLSRDANRPKFALSCNTQITEIIYVKADCVLAVLLTDSHQLIYFERMHK
jgi:hypothetical protein